MAELNENFFEMMEKKLAGVVVALYVIVESQMVVHGQSSDQRDPADASWGQWVTMQRLRPSQNAWGVAKRLV